MNEEMVHQMMAAAERLAAATETLDRVLGKLDAQQEMLNAKVDRIVAAVEENVIETTERPHAAGNGIGLLQRLGLLGKINSVQQALAVPVARNALAAVADWVDGIDVIVSR